MKEIKWINAAEQKPAEDQKVLVLSNGISGAKMPNVCENIAIYRNGQFWSDSAVVVTRGDNFEKVANLSWEMLIENAFAWTDLAAIFALCDQLVDMVKKEDEK